MSKASRARYEANRANAKLSHGPTSAHGKHRSSQNAIRHGLTGRVVVLPNEDMEAYKKFSKEIVDSLNPETPMETQFAQTIADSQWRLNRARTFEDGMIALGYFEEAHFEGAANFTAESPDIHSALSAAKVFRDRSKDFVNLSLYEQRISRAQKEAYRQLRELQAERKAAAPPPLVEAAEEKPLTQAAAALSAPPSNDGQALSPQPSGQRRDAVVSGFVCSTLEINPSAPEKTALNMTQPCSHAFNEYVGNSI